MMNIRSARLPLLIVLLGALSACEVAGSPRTGEGNIRLGIPGTAANEAIFLERWNSCIQFASPSVCARRFGGRTPAGSPADLPDESP